MDEKKYYKSFIQIFLFLELVWAGISLLIILLERWTLGSFIVLLLSGLIPMAIFSIIIVLLSPFKINEKGLVIKNTNSRIFYTKWEVINWDDIYSVNSTKLICFKYLQLFCKSHAEPIWIPLFVMNKSRFIEDLIRYVPDENPLKAYITISKIFDVNKL